ncbi:MAG: peptidylprolyl isomerase [Eubacteriales bacterium]|nr:peptidylprolyl isomerase [Eubacteriales bacterium]
MSKSTDQDKKAPVEKWKAESLREQRRERLAELKSRDGAKKPLRTSNIKTRIISWTVIVALLLSAGVWALFRAGVPHRQMSAMVIGDEKIMPAEVSYYYHTLLTSYGIDPNTAEGQTTLKSLSGLDDEQTIDQYIKELAVMQLHEAVLLTEEAESRGLTLSDDQQSQIDTMITTLKDQAKQQGMTLNQYLSAAYGTGVNETVLSRVYHRSLMSGLGADAVADGFSFSESELDAYYQENKATYDAVDYRSFYIAADIPEDASEAGRTKAMKLAEDQAEKMADAIENESDFREQSVIFASDEQRESYENDDLTLVSGRTKERVNPIYVANWLFDDARKAGDLDVVESTAGYYVVYLIERYRPDYHYIDVRHILVSSPLNSSTEEQRKEAKTEADRILADYLAGEMTEDAFAALAAENSADGNAAQGGLYEDVSRGMMVEPFDAWCFDPQRNNGDTGIVETDFGYHVMYFSNQKGIAWQVEVDKAMRDAAFTEHLTQAKEERPYATRGFGMRLVG